MLQKEHISMDNFQFSFGRILLGLFSLPSYYYKYFNIAYTRSHILDKSFLPFPSIYARQTLE